MNKNRRQSDSYKKRHPKNTAEVVYIGKYEHHFNQVWTENQIKALADEMLEWFELIDNKKPKNIWLKDFAIQKRITKQRLFEFIEKNEYFGQVYELCKSIQESYLFKLGLSKSVNPGMPVFALKNVADWKDKDSEPPLPPGQKRITVEYITPNES